MKQRRLGQVIIGKGIVSASHWGQFRDILRESWAMLDAWGKETVSFEISAKGTREKKPRPLGGIGEVP